MMRSTNPTVLEATFKALAGFAASGERCPENRTNDIYSDVVTALCRAGRVRVEISGRNYRQVHILEGEHKGKATAPNPSGARAWKTIGSKTVIDGQTQDCGKSRRPQPPTDRGVDYFSLRSAVRRGPEVVRGAVIALIQQKRVEAMAGGERGRKLFRQASAENSNIGGAT
jgi:hypothetical protein